MRLIVFGCYTLVWVLGYLAGKYLERRKYRGIFGSLASSGVAQLRAQQFEAAMKEGGTCCGISFAGEPERKPWPLDRRSRMR